MGKKVLGKREEKSTWEFLELDNAQARPDVMLSLFLMTWYVLVIIGPPLRSLYVLLVNPTKALSMARVLDETVGLALRSFIIMIWFAMCFGTVRTEEVMAGLAKKESTFFHNFMSKGVMGHNFMPGGFAPRYFGLSLGILLFCNQNMLATVNVKGTVFNAPVPGDPPLIHKWPDGIGCRANCAMPATAAKIWLARIFIQDPIGCYEVYPPSPGEVTPWRNSFYDRPSASTPNLVNPFIGGGNSTVDTNTACMYQCVAWKSLSVVTFLLKSGVILAGGVFIERLTNWATSRYGPKFITPRSSPEELGEALDNLLSDEQPPLAAWRRSIFWIILVAVEGLVYMCAPMIAVDGQETVDYYVTTAFVLSVTLALLFRNVNLITGKKPVYTQRLWSDGQDVFQCRKVGKKLNVDLYEWAHVLPVTKAQLLCDYARGIDWHDPALPDFDIKDMSTDEAENVPQVPAPFNSVRQRLLDIQDRMASMESAAGGPKNSKGKDKDLVRVLKQYTNFSDIFLKDADGEWVTLKLKISLSNQALGRVVARYRSETVMVDWFRSDAVIYPKNLHPKQKEMIQNSPVFLAEIGVKHLVEHTDKWHELQDRINKTRAKREAMNPDLFRGKLQISDIGCV